MWETIKKELIEDYPGYAEELEVLEDDEMAMLLAILETETECVGNALDYMHNGTYDFYPGKSLEEIAEELVCEGCLGNVPQKILRYINYNEIANDLSYDGYVETTYGTLHCN